MQLLLILVGLLIASTADAKDLLWDRNSESDMSHYRVYACKTKGCTVTQSGPMLQPGSISQTPVGGIPKYTLPDGEEGAAAVSAIDTSANESGLSVAVPFDAKAPGVPANPRLP